MAQIFKGPQFYLEEDCSNFKGREKETRDLLYIVEHSDFSVCYAVSGEGKSSLINAGLCPKLRDDGFLPIHVKNIAEAEVGHFDEYVWEKVKEAIEKEKIKERYSALSIQELEINLENDKLSDSIWWKFRTREFHINPDETVIPVLVFDQFEEVFSSAKDLSWTDAFFCWLEQLYQDENPINGSFSGILQKKFKILFSLRSEYVCELDYWSMNKYFIPSLKNNRYFLKPLTKASALEVANLLDGITDTLNVDDVIKFAKAERTGEWKFIKEDIPCVSALILSLILTGLSEKNIEVESKIESISATSGESKGKEVFIFLLDNVYKRALQKCGEADHSEVKNYIEALEDTLIDVNNRRRHVSERELPSIKDDKVKEALKILENERIINVIDNHYEISHDSLCQIILKRKEERQRIKEEELLRIKERAIKLKEQREDAFSSIFLLLLLIFVVWLLSTVYKDKPTYMALLDLNCDHIVKFYNEQLLFNIILGNLVILPILIYSAIKKLKITSWLSVYGIISNAVLLFLFIKDQDKEIGIRTALGVVAIGVPTTTLIYSYLFHTIGIPKREEFKILYNSTPIVVFFLAVSLYLFWLCIYNDTLGIPDPSDSFWGVVIIPLLTHHLLRQVFKQKERLTPLFLLLLSLGLLAYNNFGISPCLPSYICFALIVCTILASIWQHSKLSPIKCATASFVQFIVIVITVILNLGFNPIHIDYDAVSHVYNWKEVIVKDGTDHIGVAEACSGDTLFPCVFDSIFNYYIYQTSNRIQYKCDTIDYVNRFRYNKKTGEAQYQCLYIPSMEQYIYKIARRTKVDTTLSDSIQYYAAKSYFELRNANISFLQKGEGQSLVSVPSLSLLYDSQMEELYRSLDTLKSGNISEMSVTDFNKSFARAFYLCLVKDRIVKNDSINLFSLCQDILPLYFYDSSNDWEITNNITFDINFGKFHKSYSRCTKVSVLRENVYNLKIGNDKKIEAWYNLIEFYTLLDMSLNVTAYYSNMDSKIMSIISETRERIKKIEENLSKQNKLLSKLGDLAGKEKLSPEELIEAMSLAVQGIKEWSSSKKQLKNTEQLFSGKLSSLDEERIQIDMDFRNLINKAFLVLPTIVTDSQNQNIYNADFSNICELLYMVASVRLYDMSSIYLQELEHMDGAKMKTYVEFKKTQEEKNKMLQKIQGMANKVH